jgi:hypothetical protein
MVQKTKRPLADLFSESNDRSGGSSDHDSNAEGGKEKKGAKEFERLAKRALTEQLDIPKKFVILDGDIQKLWPGEVSVLEELFGQKVSQTWGYRSAVSGEHEHFEERTHEPEADGTYLLLSLQKYTDPVFRTVQEVGGGGGGGKTDKVFKSTLEKTVDRLAPDSQRAARQLLNEFLEKRGMRQAIQNLADQPLEGGATFAFAFVVISARALLALANGDFERAILLRDAMKNPEAFSFARERL